MALALNAASLFVWPCRGGPPAALGGLYSWLCHRQPGRCYALCGEPMPACARCVGVWLGLAAMAAFAAAGVRPRARTGALLLGWVVASWFAGRWLPAEWHAERTAAGLAGGVGLYVLLDRASALAWRWNRRAWRR